MDRIQSLKSRITGNFFFWYAVVCIVGLAIWSMLTNIGQRHYIKEASLTFVAQFIYAGSVAAGLGIGAWLGLLVYRRTSRTWVGWVAGIVICLAVFMGIREIGHALPDVGWRVKAIENYEPLD